MDRAKAGDKDTQILYDFRAREILARVASCLALLKKLESQHARRWESIDCDLVKLAYWTSMNAEGKSPFLPAKGCRRPSCAKKHGCQ